MEEASRHNPIVIVVGRVRITGGVSAASAHGAAEAWALTATPVTPCRQVGGVLGLGSPGQAGGGSLSLLPCAVQPATA